MEYFREEHNESPFYLEHPEHRTKVTPNFADTFVANLVNNDRRGYGLAWVGETNVVQLSQLLDRIGGEFRYNEFDLQVLLDTLRDYAVHHNFYFGREGSPVLYLFIGGDAAHEIAKLTKADECDYDGNLMYRLWWD